MSSAFNAPEQPEEVKDVKDRTKLLWIAVLIAIVLMAGVLAVITRPVAAPVSRAYVKHIYIPFYQRAEREEAMILANEVRDRIVSGELTFEDAARQYSKESSSAGRGGHLGWLEPNDLAEGIAKEFVWKGPVGELSDVLESDVGFHLLYVDKRELSAREQYERELHERVLRGQAGDGSGG